MRLSKMEVVLVVAVVMSWVVAAMCGFGPDEWRDVLVNLRLGGN